MHKPFSRRAALFPVLLLSAVGGMPAAHAQIGPMDPNQIAAHAADRVPPQTSKILPQPPALPGAVSSGGAAPATKIPLDMSPNDALFDAINRGDVAAARDALGRGADLRAHNILGMTPMEVSVDLGRNDISFLLLSYRGSDQSNGRQPPAAVTAVAVQPAAPTKAAPAKTAQRNPIVPVKAVVPAPMPAAPQTPRLFANDGGAPVPSAGFLGFGSQGGAR